MGALLPLLEGGEIVQWGGENGDEEEYAGKRH